MNKNLKGILVSAGALFLIAAVATAALAGTNALTKDKIAAINEQVANEARLQVIGADEFLPFSLKTDDGKEVTCYEALQDGQIVGYVFTATVSGKSSGMEVMTGVDPDGKVTGVAITQQNETAGYVDKVTKGGLLERLKGQTSADGVDGVSQATRTSNGIKKGVAIALGYFEKVMETHPTVGEASGNE